MKEDGGLTFSALEKMSLLKSVVYEVLRIDPPVPYQYAKAKQDIVIESHDSAFKIKKGEMIFGYQPIATKDPKVFENPEEFVGDRFIGEKGEASEVCVLVERPGDGGADDGEQAVSGEGSGGASVQSSSGGTFPPLRHVRRRGNSVIVGLVR